MYDKVYVKIVCLFRRA